MMVFTKFEFSATVPIDRLCAYPLLGHNLNILQLEVMITTQVIITFNTNSPDAVIICKYYSVLYVYNFRGNLKVLRTYKVNVVLTDTISFL